MIRAVLLIVALVWAALPGAAQDRPAMAVNLAPVTDWSTEAPFLDVMKTARRWIGHRPGQWGGVDFATLDAAGVLDADGWPTRIPPDLGSIGTVILTDLPEEASAYAGRYRLRFDGDGIVEVTGRARNVRYGKGEISFDFSPGPGPVDIRIQRTDRRNTGDSVRNITVVKMEYVDAFDAGAWFNPMFLQVLDGFEVLRFMDWMNTNDSTQGDWQQRPRVDDFSYTRRGVPVEVMLALAAQVGADPWFNMPHLADDAYVRAFAAAVLTGLPAGRSVYVEYSNELWNWQFVQAEWADAQGAARWGEIHRGAQFSGMRAAEVADIWSGVFADARDRLVNVIATQTGWLGLEADILDAPLWQAEAAGNRPPHLAFDAYAIAGYFGHVLGTEKRAGMLRGWLQDSLNAARMRAEAQGLRGAAQDGFVAAHRYDLATGRAVEELSNGVHSGDPQDSITDLATRIFPYHADVARRHGLRLVMYEGGSHVVGVGPEAQDEALTDFFIHLNYSTPMATLHDALLAQWQQAGGTLFNVYSDVQAPGRWGSWGALRYLGDDTPRWQVLEQWK